MLISNCEDVAVGLGIIYLFPYVPKIGKVLPSPLVTIVVLISFVIYKKQAVNPILITTIVFYYISFFINPVLGFRFSPYVFMAILLFNFKGVYGEQMVRIVNVISFLLFPYFLYTLFDTHSL